MELLLLLGVLGLGGVAGLFDPLPFGMNIRPQNIRTYTESGQYTKNTNWTENEIDRQKRQRKFTPREEVVRSDGAMAFPGPQKFPSSIPQHLSSNKTGGMNSAFPRAWSFTLSSTSCRYYSSIFFFPFSSFMPSLVLT